MAYLRHDVNMPKQGIWNTNQKTEYVRIVKMTLQSSQTIFHFMGKLRFQHQRFVRNVERKDEWSGATSTIFLENRMSHLKN